MTGHQAEASDYVFTEKGNTNPQPRGTARSLQEGGTPPCGQGRHLQPRTWASTRRKNGRGPVFPEKQARGRTEAEKETEVTGDGGLCTDAQQDGSWGDAGARGPSGPRWTRRRGGLSRPDCQPGHRPPSLRPTRGGTPATATATAVPGLDQNQGCAVLPSGREAVAALEEEAPAAEPPRESARSEKVLKSQKHRG